MRRPFATTGRPFGRVTMRPRIVSSGTEASPSIVTDSTAYLGPGSTTSFTITGSVPDADAVTFTR